MSRIGKVPITLPSKVSVSVTADKTVKVEGPKGQLSKQFAGPVKITVEKGVVRIAPTEETRFAGMMHGTVRAIINNMVKGVVDGYSRNLEIHGVGFKAAMQGTVLNLALGYSHPINYPIPAGIKVVVTDNTKLEISGADKELVGKVSSEIKSYYPVEPYKGKGVRVVGQYIRRKEGKKAG